MAATGVGDEARQTVPPSDTRTIRRSCASRSATRVLPIRASDHCHAASGGGGPPSEGGPGGGERVGRRRAGVETGRVGPAPPQAALAVDRNRRGTEVDERTVASRDHLA